MKLETMVQRMRANVGDSLLAVSKLQMEHETLMRHLRRDCAKSKPGSLTRLHYLRALGREVKEHAELLQGFGYLPKTLGVQIRESYSFSSRVTMGGSTKAVDDDIPYSQAEFPPEFNNRLLED